MRRARCNLLKMLLTWVRTVASLIIKAVFLALALLGYATLWMAVFADMGASLIVILNGMRLLRDRTLQRTGEFPVLPVPPVPQ